MREDQQPRRVHAVAGAQGLGQRAGWVSRVLFTRAFRARVSGGGTRQGALGAAAASLLGDGDRSAVTDSDDCVVAYTITNNYLVSVSIRECMLFVLVVRAHAGVGHSRRRALGDCGARV